MTRAKPITRILDHGQDEIRPLPSDHVQQVGRRPRRLHEMLRLIGGGVRIQLQNNCWRAAISPASAARMIIVLPLWRPQGPPV
jgi:hypothetical protein